MENLNWGSLPDWVAAIGTVGSLLIGFWLLKNEIIERRKREAEEETKPARHVSAWCEIAEGKYILSVKNIGEEPVYNCMIFSTLPIVDKLFPGMTPHNAERMFGVIPPNGTAKCEFDEIEYEYQGLPDVEVEFTDTSGRHWRRDAQGNVKQVTERTPWD